MSKNPKPLYRRSVPDTKPFRILHSDSNFGIRNTNSLPSLYAQMTFLANAVRNTDGTTSYKVGSFSYIDVKPYKTRHANTVQ